MYLQIVREYILNSDFYLQAPLTKVGQQNEQSCCC